MLTTDEERPVTAGRGEKPRRHSQDSTRSGRSSTRSSAGRSSAGGSPAISDARAPEGPTQVGGEHARHAGLMRMLAVIRDRLAPGIPPVQLYRRAALAGPNANHEMAGREPGVRALNADQDAQALLEVASDDLPTS